eukprot:g3429.t1
MLMSVEYVQQSINERLAEDIEKRLHDSKKARSMKYSSFKMLSEQSDRSRNTAFPVKPLTISKESNQNIQKIFEDTWIQETMIKLEAFLCDMEDPQVQYSALLGRGSFGNVYRCHYHERSSAIKMYKGQFNYQSIKAFMGEALIMSAHQHPNILRLLACHFSPISLFIVSEIAPHGTLYDCILSDSLNLTLNNHILSILLDIARGLNFLHLSATPLIHRDIKPENILIGDGFLAKITDFGESVLESVDEESGNEKEDDKENATDSSRIHQSHGDIVGTPYYIAPEMLKQESQSTACDIYSFGVLMMVISTFYHEHRAVFSKEYCSLLNLDTMTKKLEVRLNLAELACWARSRSELDQLGANKGQRFHFQQRYSNMVMSGSRPSYSPFLKQNWPKLFQLIEACCHVKPEKRPGIHDVLRELHDIQMNVPEDKVFTMKNFPLRKYLFQKAMKMYRYHMNGYSVDSSTTHVDVRFGVIKGTTYGWPKTKSHEGVECTRTRFDISTTVTPRSFFQRYATPLGRATDTYFLRVPIDNFCQGDFKRMHDAILSDHIEANVTMTLLLDNNHFIEVSESLVEIPHEYRKLVRIPHQFALHFGGRQTGSREKLPDLGHRKHRNTILPRSAPLRKLKILRSNSVLFTKPDGKLVSVRSLDYDGSTASQMWQGFIRKARLHDLEGLNECIGQLHWILHDETHNVCSTRYPSITYLARGERNPGYPLFYSNYSFDSFPQFMPNDEERHEYQVIPGGGYYPEIHDTTMSTRVRKGSGAFTRSTGMKGSNTASLLKNMLPERLVSRPSGWSRPKKTHISNENLDAAAPSTRQRSLSAGQIRDLKATR